MMAPDPAPRPRDPNSVRSQLAFTLAVAALGALVGGAELTRLGLHAIGVHRLCDHRAAGTTTPSDDGAVRTAVPCPRRCTPHRPNPGPWTARRPWEWSR